MSRQRRNLSIEQSRDGVAAPEPQDHTKQAQPSPLAQNKPHHVFLLSAKGHSNPNLASALSDGIGCHAVNPDGRQCKTERRERTKQIAKQRNAAKSLIHKSSCAL